MGYLKKALSKKADSDEEVQQQFKIFGEAIILYFKSMGTFTKKIGEIEKNYPEAFKTITELASPEILVDFAKKAPPEIVAKMFEIILTASSLSARMKKGMMELTSDEKIEIGNQMIKLANDLSELMKKAEE